MLAFNGGLALYSDEMPDVSKPMDIEIGLTGDYKNRGFSLSTKHFEQMIKNHADSGVDPAVDREHESWFGTTSPEARGWVSSMDIRPATGDKRKSALVARVELNDLGQHALLNKHFRYVSMGLNQKTKNRNTNEDIGASLDHLALVKHPYIQGMRPLSLSLSSKFGRLVEEESPMDKLAELLRAQLGLSADAPEEEIVKALAVVEEKKKAAATSEQNALTTALDEQKRINARMEATFAQLSADAEAVKARAWSEKVELAVKEFRLSPAEAKEHVSLTGAERAVAEKLLSLRTPHKPAEAVEVKGFTATTAAGKGTVIEGFSAEANAAVAAYKSSNPSEDDYTVLRAVMAASPQLFGEV